MGGSPRAPRPRPPLPNTGALSAQGPAGGGAESRRLPGLLRELLPQESVQYLVGSARPASPPELQRWLVSQAAIFSDSKAAQYISGFISTFSGVQTEQKASNQLPSQIL